MVPQESSSNSDEGANTYYGNYSSNDRTTFPAAVAATLASSEKVASTEITRTVQSKVTKNQKLDLQTKDDRGSHVNKKILSVDEGVKVSLKNDVDTNPSIEFVTIIAVASVAITKPPWEAVDGTGTTRAENSGIVDDRLSEKRERGIRFGVSYINSIMREYDEVPDGHGMKVLKNAYDIESGGNWNIIIRKVTESFWKTAIHLAEAKSLRVCALGTPGIGKSKTTAILIRLLLQENRTVVYHLLTNTKKGWVYEFKPSIATQDGKRTLVVEVSIIPEKDLDIELIPSLVDVSSNYYIVDPGRTKDDCCPPDSYQGKFILVSSPDERHWGGSEFLKRRGSKMGTFLYYPLWSLEELLNARPYIRDDISDNSVIERFHQVGGVPRHIFDDDERITEILEQQSIAVGMLTDNQLERIAQKEWSLVQTMSDKQPKSLVMGYGWSGPSFNKSNVVVISGTVLEKIVDKHKMFLWSKITSLGVDRGNGLGWQMFEVFCRNLMIGSSPYTSCYKECVGKKETLENENKTDMPEEETYLGTKEKSVSLGGCISIKLSQGDIVQAAKNTPMVVFHSADPTNKLIDFVFLKNDIFYAFQVTIGQKHDANVTEIRKLARAVGGPEFLHLYYLVPSFNFSNFSTKPVNPVAGIVNSINADLRHEREDEEKAKLQNEIQGKWIIRVLEIKDPGEKKQTRKVAMACKGKKDDAFSSPIGDKINILDPNQRKSLRRSQDDDNEESSDSMDSDNEPISKFAARYNWKRNRKTQN